jgi:hypothetical protein
MKLATLINIHLAVSSMREHAASNATAERVIDVPPPPTYHEVLNEPNSVALEIRSPGIVDAAECMVTGFSPPAAAGGESLSPPEKRLTDHYLPAELSSLTLEDDHGVSNRFYCFFACSCVVCHTSFDDTTSPRLSYAVGLDCRRDGGMVRRKSRYKGKEP